MKQKSFSDILLAVILIVLIIILIFSVIIFFSVASKIAPADLSLQTVINILIEGFMIPVNFVTLNVGKILNILTHLSWSMFY